MSRKGTYQATKNRNTHRKQATMIELYLRECSSESVMTTTSQGPKAAVINISSESRQELILAFQRGTTRAKRPNSGKRGYKSIFPHKMRLCPRAALRRSRAQDPAAATAVASLTPVDISSPSSSRNRRESALLLLLLARNRKTGIAFRSNGSDPSGRESVWYATATTTATEP